MQPKTFKKCSNGKRCLICGQDFESKKQCKTHIKSSNSDRIFDYRYYYKSFKQKGHLTSHERIQTEVGPYKCDGCDKTFKQKGNLKRHQRIHTGARPYKCYIC